MSRLPTVGSHAPAFTLRGDRNQEYPFPAATDAQAELLVFLKHDCATCSMIVPVVEHLYQATERSDLRILAISQSSGDDTAAFLKQNRLTFPTALDVDLTVSDHYLSLIHISEPTRPY